MGHKAKRVDPPKFDPTAPATLTVAGNIIKLTVMTRPNTEQTIQRLTGGDGYVVMSTGEVKEIQHTENRAQGMDSIRQTLQRLSMLINANTDKPERCRFVTLTYAENMRDPKKLYHDFELFMKRFRYYLRKEGHSQLEYIAVAEPQARGAWHMHIILIFPKQAPFIPNDILSKKWGHGFVHIRSIDNVDNVGAYLCAYLADLELPEGDSDYTELLSQSFNIIEHEVNGNTKRFIKGGRLNLYPPGMNIYRCSKGVKRPSRIQMDLLEAERFTEEMSKTYEKAIQLNDKDSDFTTIIYTRYYNRKRKNLQQLF